VVLRALKPILDQAPKAVARAEKVSRFLARESNRLHAERSPLPWLVGPVALCASTLARTDFSCHKPQKLQAKAA
jgi:hypothetical protein